MVEITKSRRKESLLVYTLTSTSKTNIILFEGGNLEEILVGKKRGGWQIVIDHIVPIITNLRCLKTAYF